MSRQRSYSPRDFGSTHRLATSHSYPPAVGNHLHSSAVTESHHWHSPPHHDDTSARRTAGSAAHSASPHSHHHYHDESSQAIAVVIEALYLVSMGVEGRCPDSGALTASHAALLTTLRECNAPQLRHLLQLTMQLQDSANHRAVKRDDHRGANLPADGDGRWSPRQSASSSVATKISDRNGNFVEHVDPNRRYCHLCDSQYTIQNASSHFEGKRHKQHLLRLLHNEEYDELSKQAVLARSSGVPTPEELYGQCAFVQPERSSRARAGHPRDAEAGQHSSHNGWHSSGVSRGSEVQNSSGHHHPDGIRAAYHMLQHPSSQAHVHGNSAHHRNNHDHYAPPPRRY